MDTQRARLTDPSDNAHRPAPGWRGALTGAAFALVLVIGLFAKNAVASSPLQGQSTVPPSTEQIDKASFGLYLPQIVTVPETAIDDIEGKCAVSSDAVFAQLPVVGPPVDHPPPINADLNLSVRDYVTVTAPLALIDINGPTDSDAPQLASLAAWREGPKLVEAYQVNAWNWACEDERSAPWYGHGCRGEPIASPPVTLLALSAAAGDPVRVPARGAEIHAGGYVALVLYAEEKRITLVYTREDTPAHGYVVHIEDICVEPALLNLYRQLDAAGRSSLPAVHSLERIGTATNTPMKAAIRDSGAFMDPRSRKDWWRGY